MPDREQPETHGHSPQQESAQKNRTSCAEIKDIQMVEMERGPSTHLELGEESGSLAQPKPTQQSLIQLDVEPISLDGASWEKKAEVRPAPTTHIIMNQNYVYKATHNARVQEQTTRVKSVREKGTQKNTFMTNEFTVNNNTGTSKEVSHGQRSGKRSKHKRNSGVMRMAGLKVTRREPNKSSLSLKQLTQTLKQNDRILDTSSEKKTENESVTHETESRGRTREDPDSRRGARHQDKMYFNPAKLMSISPPRSIKRSLNILKPPSQLVENSQIYKEGASSPDPTETPQAHLSQIFNSSRVNQRQLRTSAVKASKSFQNLPVNGKSRTGLRTYINSKSIINSQSVLIDSQTLLHRDFSPDRSRAASGNRLAKKNKSEFFGQTRDKIKRFMDKSLPSCSLFLRAKTMTEVAQRSLSKQQKLSEQFQETDQECVRPRLTFEGTLEQKLRPGNDSESREESECLSRDGPGAKSRGESRGSPIKVTQNIEIPMVSQTSNFASIQNLHEKVNTQGKLLYPTPLNSVNMPSQNLTQNIYSRPSVSTENPVQEIQIYSRSRPDSETGTLNSSTPKQPTARGRVFGTLHHEKAKTPREGAEDKSEYKIDTHSDGLQGVDTRFSEYTPREIDSLIYNNFPKKTGLVGLAGQVKSINIQNLYKNNFGGKKASDIDMERVSVSVSESNNNHEPIEDIDHMHTSSNIPNHSPSPGSRESPSQNSHLILNPAMDTFRQRGPGDTLAKRESGCQTTPRDIASRPGHGLDRRSSGSEECTEGRLSDLKKDEMRQDQRQAGAIWGNAPEESPEEQNGQGGDTVSGQFGLNLYKEPDATENLVHMGDTVSSFRNSKKNPFFDTNFSFGSKKPKTGPNQPIEDPTEDAEREKAILRALCRERRTGELEEAVIECLVEDFLEDSLYKEIFLPGGDSNEGIETDIERVETYVRQFTGYILGKTRPNHRLDPPRHGPAQSAAAARPHHHPENVLFPRAHGRQQQLDAEVQLPDHSPGANISGLREAHESNLRITQGKDKAAGRAAGGSQADPR